MSWLGDQDETSEEDGPAGRFADQIREVFPSLIKGLFPSEFFTLEGPVNGEYRVALTTEDGYEVTPLDQQRCEVAFGEFNFLVAYDAEDGLYHLGLIDHCPSCGERQPSEEIVDLDSFRRQLADFQPTHHGCRTGSPPPGFAEEADEPVEADSEVALRILARVLWPYLLPILREELANVEKGDDSSVG